LIGRGALVADVRTRLLEAGVGLLTLTGPGGSGKTRLAVEVGGAVRDAYPHGVWFVDLSALREARLVLPTIAHQLDLTAAIGDTIEDRVQNGLKDWRCLLVLDNFEQVLPAAQDVAELLAACPGVQVLVTSREPLRLRWEYELPVPPLALPDPARPAPPDELGRTPAVALFLERARAVQPALALTADSAAAITDICTRLDGLPLAIELAAAHSKVLPPRALLGRLEQDLDVLVDSAGDRPARHHTMGAAIAWSADVLNPDERVAFYRLAIFVGGFTTTAAARVCDEGEAMLETLVDKSLVRAEEDASGQPRFGMLQTVRSFALDRLARSGELATMSEAHAAWCLELVAEAEPRLRGPEQAVWLARLDQEHDNLRAALAWTLDGGRVEWALRMSGGLWRYWNTRGHLLEGQQWLERALDASRTRPVSAAAHATALNAAGEMAWGRGDMDHARACHEQSLALRRQMADRPGVAQSLQYLANLAMERGEDDTAWALHQEALDQRRQLGVPRDIAISLQSLGRLAAIRGDIDGATRLLEEALQLSRVAGDEIGLAAALRELGEVALKQMHVDQAAALLGESLSLARTVGAQWSIVRALECLALVGAARRQLHLTPRLLGAAEVLRERIRSLQLPSERASLAPAIDQARSRLGEAAFSAAWALGRATPLDTTLELASAAPAPEPPAGPPILSARELEVVALIAQGLTNRQIADQLVISERTTHAHVRNILDKLDLASRTQVATWAVRHGVARQPPQ
jgi:predicted ATPase/DNA-binding CsgD family transcriptional regulator